jgi:sodium-dependent dicarboxylate transporter 2/3/5
MAKAAEVDPMAPALGACIGSSFGFMLPVSTAPNALIYGTGRVPLWRMFRAGLVFDVIGWVIITAGVMLLVGR